MVAGPRSQDLHHPWGRGRVAGPNYSAKFPVEPLGENIEPQFLTKRPTLLVVFRTRIGKKPSFSHRRQGNFFPRPRDPRIPVPPILSPPWRFRRQSNRETQQRKCPQNPCPMNIPSPVRTVWIVPRGFIGLGEGEVQDFPSVAVRLLDSFWLALASLLAQLVW